MTLDNPAKGGAACQRPLPSITATSAIVGRLRNEQKEADLNRFLRWRAPFPTKAKASWNGRAMRAVFPGPDEPCNCVITRLDLFIHLSLHVSPATATQLLRNDAVVDEAAEITYLAK